VRAEDAQGTPTQSHISPSLLVYEEQMKRCGAQEWLQFPIRLACFSGIIITPKEAQAQKPQNRKIQGGKSNREMRGDAERNPARKRRAVSHVLRVPSFVFRISASGFRVADVFMSTRGGLGTTFYGEATVSGCAAVPRRARS